MRCFVAKQRFCGFTLSVLVFLPTDCEYRHVGNCVISTAYISLIKLPVENWEQFEAKRI